MSFTEVFRKYFMPNPTCSNSCSGDLPTVKFNDCTPNVVFSEIRRIFMGKYNIAPFTDWKLAAEWIARISSTSTEPDAIRVLTVIGDKPAPAGVTKQISNGRRVVIGKDHTVNWTIDDVSQENYEFMRTLECGGKYSFWYETEGGMMFGGNSGIKAEMESNNVLGRGREEIETIIGSFFWRSKFSPERAPSPIFGSSTNTGDFDTTLLFATTITDADAGVTATAIAMDPDLKFEFNQVSPRTGSPTSMVLQLGAVDKMTVNYPSDYNTKPFKWTDATGAVHLGTFTSGNVNFV